MRMNTRLRALEAAKRNPDARAAEIAADAAAFTARLDAITDRMRDIGAPPRDPEAEKALAACIEKVRAK